MTELLVNSKWLGHTSNQLLLGITMSELYDFSMNNLQGQPIDFAEFKGKVLLIVNTASQCGFTPQYEGLQALHEKYKDQGLVVMACPCNQFGKQEPGDAAAIKNDCLVNYGVDFLVTEKIEVNGEGSHPLFQFLRDEQSGMLGNKIKWNFTKFLVDKNGQPVERFASTTKPQDLEKYVEQML
jgi:glutathione peroxidase